MERSKKLTVPVTPDEMRELKKIALDRDTSLSEMVHRILLDFIEEQERKREDRDRSSQG